MTIAWSGRGSRRLLADAIAAASLALLVAISVCVVVVEPDLSSRSVEAVAIGVVGSGTLPFVLGFGAVGLLLARRLPKNPIGWCFSVGGLMWAAGTMVGTWAQLALTGHVPIDLFARICATVGTFSWIFAMPFSVQLPLLLLPDGRVLSRRWRPVAWLSITGLVIGTVGFTTIPGVIPGTDPRLHVMNPLGVRALGPLPEIVALTGAGMLLAGLAAGVVAVVLRYRRAREVQRQQLRWVALGGCCVLLAPLAALVPGVPPTVNGVVGTLGIVAVPVCVGVAVLRYRLYDLGRLVSRTVSYALVTALLLTVYLTLVTVAARLLPDNSAVAVAASTLVAAALFQPLRRRVQKLVDHRFNRARYNADHTVAGFTRRLRDEVDLETVRGDLLRTVDATLQPSLLGLWLPDPGARR